MVLGTSDVILVILLCYFILMNVTVERHYCEGSIPIEKDHRFLMPETLAFCAQHNKLFLSRPDWMVKATCVSAYVFLIGYIMILTTSLTKSWRKMALPTLLFIGAKAYGIFFYHYMEFTHPTLAPATDSLIPYFSVEGPYVIAMGIVIYKISGALNSRDEKMKKN